MADPITRLNAALDDFLATADEILPHPRGIVDKRDRDP